MRNKVILLIFFLGVLLRTYQVSTTPPSLYWDEASLGYNSYSIARTLHDEHGEFLPMARFIAFGDYKAPGYIYLDALIIKFLGMSEFTVRLPSVISGSLFIFLAYFLVNELFFEMTSKNKQRLAYLAAFVVAISPWSIQMSRAAFEANLATLFSGLGLFYLLRAIRLQRLKDYLFSSLFLAFSVYTFNSQRVFIPLILGLIFLILLLKKILQFGLNFKVLRDFRKLFLTYLVFFALCLPLLPHMLSAEGKLRFNEVTWLNDLDLVKIANARKARDPNSYVGDIIHNRRLIYSLEFLKHYSDEFNPKFLFYTGDVNPRLSSQNVGEFYWIELPLLLMGLYFLLRNKITHRTYLFAWLLLAPIPAALARETPHALRSLNILPIPQILVAYGLFSFLKLFKNNWQRKIAVIFIIGYALSVFSYLWGYYKIYPQTYASQWQDGYKQMVEYVSSVESNYDHIYVTSDYGRPYIYFLFFNKTKPEDYWASRKVDRDWYGFWYVYGFGKYVFTTPSARGKWLMVRSASKDIMTAGVQKIIYNSYGQPTFVITSETL